MGERGGCLPVMSSSCRPPKLLIRKSAIYRLLRRDRTLKDQQLGRVRGKWTRVLRLCKHLNQNKAKKMYLCREKNVFVPREILYSRQTRQLSLEPLYVGTKSSLPRATQMPRPKIELGTFRSSVAAWLLKSERLGATLCATTTRSTPTPTTSVKWIEPSKRRSTRTVWPSGLRRWLQAPVRKGVGSNPTAVISQMSTSGFAVTSRHIRKKCKAK